MTHTPHPSPLPSAPGPALRHPLRLAFMGSPDFAVPALEALITAGYQVVAVYCQPPRPAGRGHRVQPCAVHAVADARGLTVRHPPSLRPAEVQSEFAALDLDVAVVAAYGLILPRALLVAPRLGCINVHGSLLPRWRGAAPIHRALMAGDAETGITIMQMDTGLDTGPMLSREAIPIMPRATVTQLHDHLADLGARLLTDTLAGLVAGTVVPEPQPHTGVTYAAKLGREEGRLDWSRPALELDRRIRALNPWPGAWFEAQGERIRVLIAEPAPGVPGATPGTLLDRAPTLACGEEALRLIRLQRPGRASVDGESFLRGFSLG